MNQGIEGTEVVDILENEGDLEGSFSEVHVFEDFVIKKSSVELGTVDETLHLTAEISPVTSYEVFDDLTVIKQDRADNIYRPETEEELQAFMMQTSPLVDRMISRGLAVDFKPENFGDYDGTALYVDNADLASVRSPENPVESMASQLQRQLDKNEFYRDVVPSQEEITGYWHVSNCLTTHP